MHSEHAKAQSGPIITIAAAILLFLFGALVFVLLPEAMPYRWAAEAIVAGLVLYSLYTLIRSHIAEYDYTLDEGRLIVTRGKLGFLRDLSLPVELEDAIIIAPSGDPVLKGYGSAPADNFCPSLKGRFGGGTVLVYREGEKNFRRLKFEPSEKLVALIREDIEKAREAAE